MSDASSDLERLGDLLRAQLLAVLGTHDQGAPYTSLVGFAATPDLHCLLFATSRATRKHANLVADGRASMLVDNRSNQAADFTDAIAATAVGVVEEVSDAERAAFEELFLARHPQLAGFLRSPSCVALRLRVSVYVMVTHFQHVVEIHVAQ